MKLIVSSRLRRRYASLYFVVGVPAGVNELIVLEEIHLFVEVLDQYFGNVCELDIIFNFHKAYDILFQMFVGGILAETSKNETLRCIHEMDKMVAEATEDGEHSSDMEENGLSFAMQMHLGRRPSRKIGMKSLQL